MGNLCYTKNEFVFFFDYFVRLWLVNLPFSSIFVEINNNTTNNGCFQ